MRDDKEQSMMVRELDIACLARELYGLRAVAHRLPGERDHNFYLVTEAGQDYVFKLSHAGERPELLDLQHGVLEHLAARLPSIPLPRLCFTAMGEPVASVADGVGGTRYVRLLTYVPGTLLAHTRPHTPALLHALGALVGAVDRALHDFTHPAAHRILKWDLTRAAWIGDYIGSIERPDRRALVERVLALFDEQVKPALSTLRAGVIHGDANDYNVVVGDGVGGDDYRLGLIDFGDVLHTPIVCGLATAVAYAALGMADPLAAAAHVVAGYHAAFPLTEADLAVLYPLVLTRLAVSVTNAAYQQTVEPGNPYVTVSEEPAWAALEQLLGVHQRLAHYAFRHACGFPPCPHADAIVRWLADNASALRPVVDPDPRNGAVAVFDLSVASPDLAGMPEPVDMAALARLLSGRLREAGAPIGVGRYDEARLLYAGGRYEEPGADGPERRTVHLGLDLFMAAGSPVFAPLDGVVHSVADNAAPLDDGPTIVLQHTVADGRLTFFTLYGHLSRAALDGLRPGLPVARGACIGTIGDAAINGGWPPHLHLQIVADMLDRSGAFPGVARPSQRALWLNLSPDPNVIVGIPTDRFPPATLSVERIQAMRARHIGRSLSVSYRRPLKIVRGAMQYLYDEDGRAYLDAVNNVAHVGHGHPRVVRAGQEQMAVLNTNTRYLHDNLVRYAERLCATLPAPLGVCFFVCSGSEANDLALRLAHAHTGRHDLLVVDVGYHGNTALLAGISPYKFNGPGGEGPPPYVHTVPMPDLYRGEHRYGDDGAGEKYARRVEEAIGRIQRGGGGVSAFIAESLLSCGGQITLPNGYLPEAYRHVRGAGGVCIADEVQTGFGRVGTHFWGFETQGVVPDIVTMGKPMGNGHPLAAVVTTPEIAASFDNGMEYFNTFGGNPVSCAIGLAVLDVLADEGLQAHALAIGAHLMDQLRALMTRHTVIGDVRGRGLFVGIELVLDRTALTPASAQASYVANRMRERGVLVSTDGPFHNVLKIKPPMVFTRANADLLVATLDDVLADDTAHA